MDDYKTYLALIDIRSLLLEKYKELGLNENEVMVILMIEYLMKKGIVVIAPDTLSLKMNLDIKTIDGIFVGLINKGIVTIKDDLSASLDGLYKRLVDGIKIEKGMSSKYTKEESDNLYSLFENEFGRPLTSIEIEIMRGWMENGYDFELIKAALFEAINAKVKNIKYVDKVLLSLQQQQDIKKEGFTTANEKWRRSYEETVEIAKHNWLDKK